MDGGVYVIIRRYCVFLGEVSGDFRVSGKWGVVFLVKEYLRGFREWYLVLGGD